ncbi:hypothetical protein EV182_003672, partial [Spiromyces aspiralis]
ILAYQAVSNKGKLFTFLERDIQYAVGVFIYDMLVERRQTTTSLDRLIDFCGRHVTGALVSELFQKLINNKDKLSSGI